MRFGMSYENRYSTDLETLNRANRRRVESRFQKRGESFSDFVLDLQALNFRLKRPFNERDLIGILRENMNDDLQNATLLFRFQSHLRITCTRFEKQWACKKRTIIIMNTRLE